MPKSDSDFEQSYCSDDSEFNDIPGLYVIDEDEDTNANDAAASPTKDTLDTDTFKHTRTNPWRVKSGLLNMRKSKKPSLTLTGSLTTVLKEWNL